MSQHHQPCYRQPSQVLRNPESPATDAEVEAAALQFVRKISGYRQPSQANAEAFDAAVVEVAEASRLLLAQLTSRQKGG